MWLKKSRIRLCQCADEDDDDADKQKKAKDEVETKDFHRDVTDEAENKHEETPPIDLDKIFRKNIESMGMGMGPKKQRNDEKDEQ